MSYTLTPAYGRDYTSKAKIEADLLADKDFVANSYDGSSGYINLSQLRELNQTTVNVRYKQNRSVCVINLAKLKAKPAAKPTSEIDTFEALGAKVFNQR